MDSDDDTAPAKSPSPEDLPGATTLTTHHTAQLDSAIRVAGKAI
jgi:hypothetical protein